MEHMMKISDFIYHKKCLGKTEDVSLYYGITLYVSSNFCRFFKDIAVKHITG